MVWAQSLPIVSFLLSGLVPTAVAGELLVADRLTNRVLRYSETGSFLGVLLDDQVNLAEPNGLALSPDGTQLYVASRLNNSIVRYDYDRTSASNPTVVVDSGITVPASLLFSESGDTLYVSNLGFQFDGATVAQFTPHGASAGPDLTGGTPAGRSGLAFAPNGSLLVSSFQEGAVLQYNETTSLFEDFVPANQAILGASNLLVLDNHLYVTAGFTGAVMRFDATTGAIDPTFTPISNLAFPAGIVPAPDGNGLVVASLGFTNGTGQIDRYSLDGQFLETFAPNSDADPSMGYREPTGILTVTFDEVVVPGDYNGDGATDQGDLDLVLLNWGVATAELPPDWVNHLPAGEFVAQAQLDGVLLNWGETNVAAGAAAVPEPRSLTALALCAALACVRARTFR
jgi:sugar lactone lactonase YvrE